RAVQRGDMYILPSMTRALLGGMSAPKRNGGVTVDPPAEALTPRELDVLKLIARGCTNRQMAEILSISVRTVEGHRANLMGKLNLHGRVELVRYARENKLID
nr:response regulator transcription factor [Anaerolineae bacterium]